MCVHIGSLREVKIGHLHSINIKFYGVDEIRFYISNAQGDFEDPEFCMRYYHCDKNLRVSLNFEHQTKSFISFKPFLIIQASLKYCSTGNFFQPIDDKVLCEKYYVMYPITNDKVSV